MRSLWPEERPPLLSFQDLPEWYKEYKHYERFRNVTLLYFDVSVLKDCVLTADSCKLIDKYFGHNILRVLQD